VNDGPDIFGDVLDLPTLAMKGNGTKSQRLKDRDDVSLRSASDTNPQIQNVKLDEVLYKLQDFLTRGRKTG
jgi:hypothetical protein